MNERPILFSAPMVRALLDGTKTQTRRIVKNPALLWLEQFEPAYVALPGNHLSPYGYAGDRLWVRENGWERPELSPRDLREGADTWPPYEYDAEPLMCWAEGELKGYGWKRRPSIHMPRWASRIDLEVTGVRVERLQDISEADAKAEGAPAADLVSGREVIFPRDGSHRWGFQLIWQEINGLDSWAANPWVWVVEFKRIKP